jgi:DNA-binding IclR family transcriptional regulator
MTNLAEWNTGPSLREPASVIDRLLVVLDAVHESGGSASVTQIAALTGMPKSTVSRLVSDLVANRYLARTDSAVTLGLRLFELGVRARVPRRLLAAAAPVIRDLWRRTGERVGVWVNNGDSMISVVTLAGRLPDLPVRAGMRSPALTTASGKAYLAFCADDGLVDRVSAPLASNAASTFRYELSRVRENALATDVGIAYPGVVAVASPVLTGDRAVIGAISLAGPGGSIDPARVAPLVRDASEELMSRLAAA